MKKFRDYLYRKSVGVVMVNHDKKIFVGKRIGNNSDAWQMPQGGVDLGETEDNAAIRELREETGVLPGHVNVISKSDGYYYYDLPYNLQKKFWGGKYIGQKQRWYLIRFFSEDSMINVDTSEPEFSDWRWSSIEEVIDGVVPFKRDAYRKILEEFYPYFLKLSREN